jgi:hypothetical protein
MDSHNSLSSQACPIGPGIFIGSFLERKKICVKAAYWKPERRHFA